MKMRKMLTALFLSLVFAVPTFAGDILMGVVSDPNQPSQTAQQNSTSTDSVQVDPITEAIIDLLSSIGSVI